MLIVLAVLVSLLAVTFQGARSVWKRFRNNYTHRVVLFTYLDAIVVAFGAVVLCILLFPEHVFAGSTISPRLALWLKFMGPIVVLWAALVVFLPYKDRSTSPKGRGTSNTYFGDDPIVGDDEDLLGRTEFIADVYDRISRYNLPESHVFGLYGAWGEGKTSVLNLLKNRLGKNPHVIVVEFDPWYFSSNDAIVRGFFEALLTKINKSFFFPDLKRALTKYGDVLASGVSKVLGIEIRLGLHDESMTELRERIQQCIQQTGQRLIILIDDLDRLQNPADMFMVLRLVKLAGNFENTIFVLSFDPQIVAEAVNQTQDKDFLEKIVQSPIDLPAVEQSRIDAFFCVDEPGNVSHLTRLADELALTASQKEALQYGFVEHYINWSHQLFRSLRDVKRFLNGVHTRLPRIRNEVHIGDFLTLECIRLFFPLVFRDIQDHHEYYIPSRRRLYGDDEKITADIKPHIEALLTSKPRGDLALQTLKEIFPEVAAAFGERGRGRTSDSLLEEQRIAHTDVFVKYFTLGVPGQQLSDHEVHAVISGWKETEPGGGEARMLTDLLASLQSGTLPQMLEKLRLFMPKENSDIQIALARTLFLRINQFREPGILAPLNSPYHRMRMMIFQLINDVGAEGSIQPLLSEVIKGSPSLFVASSAVFFAGTQDTNYQFSRLVQFGNKEYLKIAFASRLKKDLMDEGKDVFHEQDDLARFVLLRWGQFDRATMNEYVFSLLERVPAYTAKIIDSYRSHVDSPSGGNFDYPGLVATYDEKRLYDSAVRAASMSNLTDQERQTIQAFIRCYDDLKRTATTERQRAVNQATFRGLSSGALQLFENGQYPEALKRYDEAVSITDWDDSHGWQAQLRYFRWRCLLEMARNNGQPIQTYFDQAAQVSPTEHALKGLFDAAFPNEPSVQAKAEFYNCLFYYLQWFFASDDVRTTIRKSFDDHVILGKSDRQSTSLPFIERIAQLERLMSEPATVALPPSTGP